MLTGQAAREVGVTRPTIRSWASRFAEWLSPEAVVTGQTRNFVGEDLQVLKAIKALRDRNLSYDQIEEELRAGQLPSAEEPAQQPTALVTMAQVQMMLAPISAAADEWRAIAQSRQVEIDRQREELEALRTEARQLREEMAASRRPWWRRLLS